MIKNVTRSRVGWVMGLALICCHIMPTTLWAQIGTWHNYMAYSEVQDIQSTGDELFVQASNGLYAYNLTDQSITTFDKVNGLSETRIKLIKWNRTAKKLLIVYDNQNMDLMEEGGGVTNLSDFYQKSITGDKTVNSIYNHQQYAYLACGFGIVKVDMQRVEISDSYNLNANISHVAISGGNIYAQQQNGQVLTASLTANLLNPASWQTTTTADKNMFTDDRTDYDKNIELVNTLQPGGPKHNHFFNMKMHNGVLYTVGGGFYQSGNYRRPGAVQVMNADKEWAVYQDDFKPAFSNTYLDVNSLAIDPQDENHVIVASCSGLYEFMNGEYQNNYTEGNTPYFQSAASNGSPDYVRTDGIIYDSKGNLYCLNSGSTTAIIKRSAEGTWSGFMNSALIDKPEHAMRVMQGSIMDSRGLIWFVNAHSDNPSFFCFDAENEVVVKYDRFVNQDGVNINCIPYCIVEEQNGNIWVGTSKGPFYLTNNEIADKTQGIIQYKVPRNDGTNYADYLLDNVTIKCMAIDGGGRKWFGTAEQGVYLISADNNTQIYNFTTSNSALLSNNIESIVINNESGEVFFGTENGLCSFISDATTPTDEMTDDNVYAYPNPVTPEYNGLITITGLSYEADVKILSTNGKVIAEGTSTGGTFTWNGRDKNNKRVASGVYMVATATNDGKKGTVCKIVMMK